MSYATTVPEHHQPTRILTVTREAAPSSFKQWDVGKKVWKNEDDLIQSEAGAGVVYNQLFGFFRTGLLLIDRLNRLV